MSTEITPETLKGTLLVTSFWGGKDRGVCIQLTPRSGSEVYGSYAQLTLKEVEELTDCLLQWMAEHYDRQRKLSGTDAGIQTKGQQ
jgi:hypothetical protein